MDLFILYTQNYNYNIAEHKYFFFAASFLFLIISIIELFIGAMPGKYFKGFISMQKDPLIFWPIILAQISTSIYFIVASLKEIVK